MRSSSLFLSLLNLLLTRIELDCRRVRRCFALAIGGGLLFSLSAEDTAKRFPLIASQLLAKYLVLATFSSSVVLAAETFSRETETAARRPAALSECVVSQTSFSWTWMS